MEAQPVDTAADPEVQAQVRALEIDEAYQSAYAALPMDAPDEWGDLASFGETVRETADDA